MRNTDKKDASPKDRNQIPEEKHGYSNWLLLFLLIYFFNYVIENYLNYGIVKTPFQMTEIFIGFMKRNWWIYASLFACHIFQIFSSFIIEKCLVLGVLPEKLGMGLHIFNALLLQHFSAFLFNYYDFNRFAAVGLSIYTVHMSLKFFSYGFVNKRLRAAYIKKSLKDDGPEVEYPKNVTLPNVFEFMVCTAACVYTPTIKRDNPSNIPKYLKETVKGVIMHYMVAFLLYQYLLPESDVAVECFNKGEYLKAISALSKIAMVGNVGWVLYFYTYGFLYHFASFSMIWGSENVTIGYDWWNAESTSVFWTKWNYQVHTWLKELIYVPLLKAGYNRKASSYIVAFISGILHEYMISMPCRTVYGIGLFGMLAQIPLANITSPIAKKYSPRLGNFLMWLSIVIGETLLTFIVYYIYSTRYANAS